MICLTYFVSWDSAPALRFLLAVAVLLAVTVAVPLVVAALSPLVTACCTAIAGNLFGWSMVPVVFGGAWAVKP